MESIFEKEILIPESEFYGYFYLSLDRDEKTVDWIYSWEVEENDKKDLKNKVVNVYSFLTVVGSDKEIKNPTVRS